MLTKAYIQEVISPYSVRIRMPLYNKIENVAGATPNNELHTACVCTLPNFITNTKPGDVVIVGFEEDNISNPVILGHLARHVDTPSLVDVECNDLTVKGDTKLDRFTHIGDVTPDNIACLEHLKENINDTFSRTAKDINNIYSQIATTNATIEAHRTALDEIDAEIKDSISNLTTRVENLESECKDLLNTFNEYLNRHTPVFGKEAFGDNISSVKDPKQGQLYLTLKDEIK